MYIYIYLLYRLFVMGQQLTISCKLLMPVSTSWLPKRCILLTTHLPVHVVYLYIYIDIYMKITYTFKLCVIRKTFAFCYIYICLSNKTVSFRRIFCGCEATAGQT